MKNRTYILNPVFLLALITLLVNDFYLKTTAPSFLTGKLSDLSGLVVFVLFFTFLFGDRFKKAVFIITALIFCWWKSSLSTGFIQNWNGFFPFYTLERTIDYSDLFCLLVLIPLYFYHPKTLSIPKKQWITAPVILLTVFAISATSKGRSIGAYSSDNTKQYYIHESFKIKKVTYAEFLEYLALSNIKVEKTESSAPPIKPFDYTFYTLRNYEFADDIRIESMYIGVREKNGNLKVLIQDVTLFDPPEGTEKEVKKRLMEVFEEYFAIGK
ncbi:MAG: hypothetical protein ACO1N0_11225 [Fluviicola sp.]